MKKKVDKILAAFEINVWSYNPFRFVVLYDIYKTLNSNAANQSLVKYAYVTYVMKAKYGLKPTRACLLQTVTLSVLFQHTNDSKQRSIRIAIRLIGRFIDVNAK